MAANSPRPAEPTEPPRAPDAHLTESMSWVMPIWLIAFMVAVVFGVVSYLVGWAFQRG